MNKPKSEDNWVREFDKKFPTQISENIEGYFVMPEASRQLKVFISSLIKETEDRVREEGARELKMIRDSVALAATKALEIDGKHIEDCSLCTTPGQGMCKEQHYLMGKWRGIEGVSDFLRSLTHREAMPTKSEKGSK